MSSALAGGIPGRLDRAGTDAGVLAKTGLELVSVLSGVDSRKVWSKLVPTAQSEQLWLSRCVLNTPRNGQGFRQTHLISTVGGCTDAR